MQQQENREISGGDFPLQPASTLNCNQCFHLMPLTPPWFPHRSLVSLIPKTEQINKQLTSHLLNGLSMCFESDD